MQTITVKITDFRVTAKLLPRRKLPAAVVARLQAEMAKRIEDMAYATLTGGYAPAREQTSLCIDSSGRVIPSGNQRPPGRYGAIINMNGYGIT